MEIKMRGQALLAAGVLALTAFTAVPAANAQPYGAPYASGPSYQDCGQRKTKNAILGGLLGATLGAVVGSQMGSSGHRGDVGLVGGAVGAAAGAGIGASGTNCAVNNQAAYPPAPAAYPPQANNYPPQSAPYGNDRDGDLLGGPDSRQPVYRGDDRNYGSNDRGYNDRGYNDRGYRDGRRYADNRYRDCRWADEIVRDRYGSHREPVKTCRNYRGDWVVVR
jgi:hypothetical protein